MLLESGLQCISLFTKFLNLGFFIVYFLAKIFKMTNLTANTYNILFLVIALLNNIFEFYLDLLNLFPTFLLIATEVLFIRGSVFRF